MESTPFHSGFAAGMAIQHRQEGLGFQVAYDATELPILWSAKKVFGGVIQEYVGFMGTATPENQMEQRTENKMEATI